MIQLLCSCDLCDISLPTMSMLLQHNTVWHKKVITKYEHQSQPKVIPCEHSLTSDLVNSEVGDEGGSSTSQSSAVRKTVKYKKKKTGLPYVVCQICGERYFSQQLIYSENCKVVFIIYK